jgi:hypothetical protein
MDGPINKTTLVHTAQECNPRDKGTRNVPLSVSLKLPVANNGASTSDYNSVDSATLPDQQ